MTNFEYNTLKNVLLTKWNTVVNVIWYDHECFEKWMNKLKFLKFLSNKY